MIISALHNTFPAELHLALRTFRRSNTSSVLRCAAADPSFHRDDDRILHRLVVLAYDGNNIGADAASTLRGGLHACPAGVAATIEGIVCHSRLSGMQKEARFEQIYPHGEMRDRWNGSQAVALRRQGSAKAGKSRGSASYRILRLHLKHEDA